MKLRSMEEKISYRLFLMGFLGLIFTAALCIFVFHKAFTAQAWSGLERESDLVRAGYFSGERFRFGIAFIRITGERTTRPPSCNVDRR